ncbi:Chaperone protein like [Actinidia chinensis var. chinensis]|uniref:Chaperone protein like n=1 Tax=Actinidia chinensis var. chinensis TaxID=1590841 RepID=A0A2R6PSC3_ACTCC|nr:Chaperone protein like [Actinidia chinensis var. chinensis]
MECNKVEAAKAKGIAEKKMVEGDILGSKKFALIAQNLFPELEGLAHFIRALNVFISYEKKINGEVDWYGVLGVDPSADYETLRNHYLELALILHANRNKPVGADKAFEILSEAWGLLSDKAKRAEYDLRRNLNIYQTGNGFHTFTQNYNSSARDQKSAGNPSKPSTFWTICNRCMTQYQYLRDYLNQNLRCPNCKHPFYAVEMPTSPTDGQNLKTGREKSQTDVVREKAARRESSASKRKGARLASNAGSSSGNGYISLKVSRVQVNVTGREIPNQLGRGLVSGVQVGNSGLQRIRDSGTSESEIHDLLAAKCRMEIRNKLSQWTTDSTLHLKVSNKEGMMIEREKPKADENSEPKASLTGRKKDGKTNPAFSETNSVQPRKSSLSNSKVDSSEKALEIKSMSVPDPEFYNFDKDRIEKCFSGNQVWAVYDDDDGMPRYYAFIRRVISKRPFEIELSWLNAKSNAELGPLNWVGSGFIKTSGDFRLGKYKFFNCLNSFSHVVKWNKGKRGSFQIFPKKGDAWALYSNWSPEWNGFTLNEVIHKYEMVEVLEDYNEERGVIVAPLVKVAGFKSVFCQNLETEEKKTIPREEMFRFSHQVPSYVFPGQEANRELDPAAMPLELLRVITEGEEREMVEKAKEAKKDLHLGESSEAPLNKKLLKT